ncbi:hypothetical protein WI40_25080 [Burkholderia ubonensis]|uniref:sigma 54-interacting transcriptional regulator n=1 Tax=Burkholderia ubonensis TaxID=101571 RepID=UPI000753FABD|nr:hypothetical protein WI40_25080 [Burkholderia ubonensis]
MPCALRDAHGSTTFSTRSAISRPPLQAKLLHVLPEGEATRVGATRARPVDVRVVAATSVDLERCRHCSAKQRRRERSNGRTVERRTALRVRRRAVPPYRAIRYPSKK